MSEFDKGIKKDDFITAYHGGFHRVTSVKRRFHTKADVERYSNKDYVEGAEYMALISYVTVLSGNYKPARGKKEKGCDAAYCEKLDAKAIEARRKKLVGAIEDGTKKLLELLK